VDAQKEDPTLSVNEDLGYPIVVAGDVKARLGQFLRERDARFVVLCDADPHVRRIAKRLTDRIPGRLAMQPFALGERRKRLTTLERVQDAMLSHGADRGTWIVGIGGGVASDLFGFAAATYMRGVPYVHVATSLVAMADAAIGGKTAVDLQAGKNLAGVFSDPRAVFAHVDALETLPLRQLREGLAEIVKAGVIEGVGLFETLEMLAPHPFWRWPWPAVIAQAIDVKTTIVRGDAREIGRREVLNLGHTFGHAFERASRYRISHGAGVALGLRAAGSLAVRTGRFSERDHYRVLALLTLLRMPLRTSVAPAAALAAMTSDKKKRAGTLRFVLPKAIGDVEYGVAVPDRDVRAVLVRMTKLPSAAAP
jgi:3-dehydroquinate synthetase